MNISELSALRFYAASSVIALCAFAACSWKQPTPRSVHFEEITVERINVVESDGSIRIVIANRERFPDPVVNGVVSARSSSHPGVLFYNDEGDECGGLVFSGGAERASTSLLFDRRKQDQTLGLIYNEWTEEGESLHRAGLRVWERPARPLNEVMDERRRINAIADDAQRKAAIEEFLTNLGYPDPFGAQRLFVGRDTTGEAGVILRDGAGRVRLRMVVAQTGNAKLEFLDAEGAVVRVLRAEE